ncbi:tail fiber protein [Photorhabdus tasmaniensis]
MSSYNFGTISIAANSDIATGNGTRWKDNKFGVAPAQIILIKVGNVFQLSAIKSVNSDTELVLIDKFPDAVSNAEYFIQTSVPDTYSDAARKVTAQLGYTDELLFNLNKWMTETGVVTITTPEGKSIQLKSINALASDISSRLTKDQNGADIPNKNEFVKNLGLSETVNKANNAVPSSRKVNGKVLSGDVSLSAGDVGAFPDFRGYVSNNSKFSDIRESGVYGVAIDNPNSVADLPAYNGSKLYAYGFLSVFKSNDQRIHQTYYSHIGDIATRQTWDGPERYKPWTTQYSTANPAIPVGVPLPYPHRYTPPGYLTCNGQTFNKSLYLQLAQAYPDGRVPDLRGEFIRGWDDSRGVDPGRMPGTWQADSTKRIQLAESNADSRYVVQNQGPLDKYQYPLGRDVIGSATVTSIANNTSGHETRPRNIAFNYIVRAV